MWLFSTTLFLLHSRRLDGGVSCLAFKNRTPSNEILTKESASSVPDVPSVRQYELMLLPRRIRSCRSNITACLELLATIPSQVYTPTQLQPIYLEALEVLYHHSTKDDKSKQHLAFQFYQKCPTESMRAKAISVSGGHHLNTTLWFQQRPGIVSINAALASLVRAQKWEQSQALLQKFSDDVSTFSYNVVLMGMDRASQGNSALSLLHNMMKYGPAPDRNSFHHTMAALGRNHLNDEAYDLLDCMRSNDILTNNATFDILARMYGRSGDWAMVGLVDSLRKMDCSCEPFPDPKLHRKQGESSRQQHRWVWENDALGMKRVGTGRDAWWEFASLGNLTVALQPHRNPSKNGMKILLFQRDGGSSNAQFRKVGFLLMINNRTEKSSTMLGIFIHPDFRRLGLSKTILAIWLNLCDRAGLLAKTGIINKPLLALILQHTFGFSPLDQNNRGVEVEVLPGAQGMVELYAPAIKSLEGVFGVRELEHQKIRIIAGTPSVRGRLCRIKTAFLRDKYNVIQTDDKIDLKYRSLDTQWMNVLLGVNVTGRTYSTFVPQRGELK